MANAFYRVNQLRKDIRKQESTAGDSYEALQACIFRLYLFMVLY